MELHGSYAQEVGLACDHVENYSWGLPWWAQWLRFYALNAGGPGLIPDQGSRSYMHAATNVRIPQLRSQ